MRGQKSYQKSWSNIRASDMANKTFNPIRNILETMTLTPNPDKKMISLSIGDPTVFGNLIPPQNITDAVHNSVDSGKCNGYGPSTGFLESRKAVAEHIGDNLTADDVILCSGCSCSLDLCISAVANPGENILVPRPGFPLYTTLANGLGIETKEYNLIPEQEWQVDLDHMESIIDDQTMAILINNPSNPCGSVFDEKHLKAILEIAEKYCLPIIADEIYEHFVFEGSPKKYVPMAKLSSNVPVLSCGGLTKRWLVPGWRLGWITIHDRNGVFKMSGINKGLHCLSQRIIGANTIVQGALPSILKETPSVFYRDTLKTIEENAKIAFNKLTAVPGFRPVMPSGAMYMMVRIDISGFYHTFDNDLEIVEALVTEQSVFCLPGKCFNIPNFFRIVLTVPKEMLIDACDRMMEFGKKYYDHKIAGQELAYFMEYDMEDFSCSEISDSDNEEHDQVSELRARKFNNLNDFRTNQVYHNQQRRKNSSTRLA